MRGKRIQSLTDLEKIETETRRLSLERRKLSLARYDLKQQREIFERFLCVFRNVSNCAWDAVIRTNNDTINALREALERSDSHWEGHSGCSFSSKEDTTKKETVQ